MPALLLGVFRLLLVLINLIWLTFGITLDSSIDGVIIDSIDTIASMDIIDTNHTSTSGCIGTISKEEYDALQSLYDNTHGDQWKWLPLEPEITRWKFPSSLDAPCSIPWQGITCNTSLVITTGSPECIIIEILLIDRNLTGQMPATVGNFQNLLSLTIMGNFLTGTIPSEISLLQSLIYLEIEDNHFTGTIPSELGLLTRLDALYLAKNSLIHTIPQEIWNLTSLAYLNVNFNFLTGTLPSYLGQNQSLASSMLLYDLQLTNNYFSGSLPLHINNYRYLYQIALTVNHFTGNPLPNVLNMSTLNRVIVGLNYFTGSIPGDIAFLPSLVELALQNNSFSGPVPATFQNFSSNFSQLEISYNLLDGTLPTNFGPAVSSIDISGNIFSGGLPASIFTNSTDLGFFAAGSCGLIGTIPPEVVFARDLASFIVPSNYLTGTIPEGIWNMSRIQDVTIEFNFLSGSISNDIVHCQTIEQVAASKNLLTGSIPPLNNRELQFFQIEFNYISGTLPSDLGKCYKLESLQLGTTYLEGTIPAVLSQLKFIRQFTASTTLLSGSIDRLFENSTAFPSLSYLDFSNNAFTGTIPSSIFKMNLIHQLQTAILYSNCFSGSLPSAICNARSLETLVLDSLCSNSACEVKIPPLISNILKVTIGERQLQGTVPECIWSMSALTTLHLAGNGLQGTLGNLPADGSSMFSDLSLSSNRFVGPIPLSWQSHGKFESLDLSSNKLDGTLSDSAFQIFANNTEIDFTVNRLSGDIPSVFVHADNVNILDGNLFQCTEESKPQNDPNYATYVCGSSDFDTSLIVVVSVVLALFVCMVWIWDRMVVMRSKVINCTSVLLSTGCDVQSTLTLLSRMRSVCILCSELTVGSVFVCMVSYVVLKSVSAAAKLYSTHAEQYMWITTVAYLHGVTPSVLVIVYLWCGLVLSVYCLKFRWRGGLWHWYRESSSSTPTTYCQLTKHVCTQVVIVRGLLTSCLLLVHCSVTILINVLYVYEIIVDGLPTTYLLMLQLALSVFKLSWVNLFVPWAVKRLKLSSGNALLAWTFMSVFTFLVSPVIATFFSDTSCFQYIITGQPSVYSSFEIDGYGCALVCDPRCRNVCGIAGVYEVAYSTDVVPSWLYSFECSSSLLKNYIPVLILSFMISGILDPTLRLIYLHLSSDVVERWCPLWLRETLLVDTILTYEIISARSQLPPNSMPSQPSSQYSLQRSDLSRLSFSSEESDVMSYTAKPANESSDLIRSKRRLFNKSRLMGRFVLNIAVLLTFGISSPLLALVVCLDSWSTWLVFTLAVNRFISMLRQEPAVNGNIVRFNGSIFWSRRAEAEINGENLSASALVDQIEVGCIRLESAAAGADDALSSSFTLICFTAGLFWSLFVFDMLGDVYGAMLAAIVLCLPFFGSWVVYALATVVNGVYGSASGIGVAIGNVVTSPDNRGLRMSRQPSSSPNLLVSKKLDFTQNLMPPTYPLHTLHDNSSRDTFSEVDVYRDSSVIYNPQSAEMNANFSVSVR